MPWQNAPNVVAGHKRKGGFYAWSFLPNLVFVNITNSLRDRLQA